MTKKIQTRYTCNTCGHEVSKWLGKCPECLSWNSFQEEFTNSKFKKNIGVKDENEKAQSLKFVKEHSFSRLKSGLPEFDRVVGGGLVRGTFVLCAGEPGIGKSTLLMNILEAYACQLNLEKFLYVSGEESLGQIAGRAKRLNVKSENILLLNEVLWQSIEKTLKTQKPKFLIIDSIQTIYSNEVESAPGSPNQMKEMAYQLMNYAKENDVICIAIGHITKEGAIAGPKLLEHIVDIVLTIEGEPRDDLRILRCYKNRFGETYQVGLFEMNEQGLKGVNHLITQTRAQRIDSIGCAYSLIKEGNRIFALEIQALVVENKFSHGRRISQGIDHNHLSMLIAIIEKYLGIKLASDDVYLNLSGGLRPQGRESDLAIIAAIISSKCNYSLNSKMILVGETTLAGTLKGLPAIENRLAEIKSWGFLKIVMAESLKSKNLDEMEIHNLKTIKDFEETLKDFKDRAS